MADTADLTIELLKQIRDGINGTNARLDQMREELLARVDKTNPRMYPPNPLLARLTDQTEEHTRMLQILSEFTSSNHHTDDELTWPLEQELRENSARITALETDVAALKRRAG